MQDVFEKIIEKLEEYKSNVPVNRLIDDILKDKPKELGQLMAYDNAIEIVKQESEAHNNEFCEWRLYDEDSCTYDTDCRNMHIFIDGSPSENNYLYCPYCGKMIKPYQPNGE